MRSWLALQPSIPMMQVFLCHLPWGVQLMLLATRVISTGVCIKLILLCSRHGSSCFQAETCQPLWTLFSRVTISPGDSKANASSQKLEESAVKGAMCRAFHSLDETILGEARSEGLRDGATALVVMRLGDVMYAAHAGGDLRYVETTFFMHHLWRKAILAGNSCQVFLCSDVC